LIIAREKLGAENREYIELAEKFVKEFRNVVELKNDKRVVNRFIEYAQAQSNPLLVYDYMDENGIGKSPYFLYYIMARKFEKKEQLYLALDTFREGLKINEIKDNLLEDLIQFKDRIKRRIEKNNAEVKSVKTKRKHVDRKENIEQELNEV